MAAIFRLHKLNVGISVYTAILSFFFSFFQNCLGDIKVPIAPNWKGVCYKIQVNPIHTILKYGDYYDCGYVMVQFLKVPVNGN